MKKRILTLMMLLIAFVFAAEANPVDIRTVHEVAVKFLNANAKEPLRSSEDLQLVTTYNISRGDAAFYVFNAPNGFIIVSADDCATPILGYSDEGRPFDPDNVPIQLQVYLQGYVEQIAYGIENNIQPDEATAQQWELVRTTGRLNNNRDGDAVEPLITTQWDQGWPYNALCPEGTPTGCVATAMAQIMNYWQYPAKGIGYHSYSNFSNNCETGLQFAFFNESYYQWDVMDVEHVEAISTLMYHVGVAVNMDYAPGGSGASLSSAKSALQRYFDYSESSVYLKRSDYEDSSWIEMLKSTLSDNKPVLYEGFGYLFGGYVGHGWVVDGYDDQDLFHMNFGWSGSSDGYYSISALNYVGGWYDFNIDQGAVLGICPAYSPMEANFEIEPTDVLYQYDFHDFSKGTPDQYEWHFGDGSTSSSINLTHIYDTAGVYQIMLVVSDGIDIDTLLRTVEIIDEKQFIESQVPIATILPKFSKPVALDYNRDGWMDFYIAAGGCNGEKDLYRNGVSSFCRIQIQKNYADHSVNLMPPIVVDFNHENRPSILYSTYYLYNTGDTLTFGDMDFLGIENEELPMIKGDYDGDGEDDIVYGGLLYHNVGEGHFQKVSEQQYDVACFYDYDGDGDLDLIGKELYRNEGEGAFTRMPNLINGELGGNGMHVDGKGGDIVDINLDGLPDYAIGQYVWTNLGNGTFEENASYHNSYAFCPTLSSSIALDFNCDGASDVLQGVYVSDGGGSCIVTSLVYENNNGLLNQIDSITRPSGFLSVGCIDYDNNNHPDYLFFNDNKSVLFKNTCGIENTPPSVPMNLWADVVENNVVLHWDTVSDDHSRYGSITYNIMVGTTPDGYDIKSPLSDIETGKRYAYDRGNAGHAPLWKLNNLPNGTYYWRVQAIDNSLAASQFSETGTFVVNGINFNPVMSSFSTSSVLNRDKFFSAQDIKDNYFDREGDTIQGFIISRLPNHGVLRLDNSVVEQGQSISIDDVDRLCFRTSVFENDTVFIKPYNEFGISEDLVAISIDVFLFENTFAYTLGLFNMSLSVGDYDKDGHLDLVSSDGIFHNTGSGFERLSDSIEYAENLLWLDVNNDGWLDCLSDRYMLINLGNGHFACDTVPWHNEGNAVGDINNDNKVDCLIGGSGEWRLYYNNNNVFSNDSVYDYLSDFWIPDFAIADFNNDGKQDIVSCAYQDEITYENGGWIITEWDNRRMFIYQNKGDTIVEMPNAPFVNAGSIALGDYDNDGDLDLLICGWEETHTSLYNNFGGYFIKNEGVPFAQLSHGHVKWFDYDNDGYLDVLLWAYNSVMRLYRNINGISFEEVNNILFSDLNLANSVVVIADYDGDGFEDIIISEHECIKMFSNGYGSGEHNTNNQYTVPTDLQADVQGSSVVLSWNDTTAFSYNVYVKNADGFIVSPMADISTGFRKVTDYGNAGYAKSYILRGLPAGTYQWSVQTVDRSRKGGLFADEQEFTISCNYADTTIVYDTACYGFESECGAYIESGIYYELYLGVTGCDSIIERHLTITHDCTPIIHVRMDGNNASGYTWNLAFSDLQLALNKAGEVNGQVWVAEGTYYGDGVSENAFIIPHGIQVYGGFVGNEPADYDLSLREFSAHPTILDGQHVQRTVYHDWWGNDAALLDGFTIQNGYTQDYGGNLFGGEPWLNLNNCIIKGGISDNDSGGLRNAIIRNSIILNNTSEIAVLHDFSAYNCEIINNINNTYSDLSGNTLTNCILWGNNYGFAYFTNFTNCILWGNSNGWLFIDNSTYSAIEGQEIGGEGNITLAHSNNGNSPDSLYVRFVDPENGDFRLSYGSACINAGTPDISELDLPSLDLQGLPRVLDGRIDMEPYEYYPVQNYHTYDTICDGESVTFHDEVYSTTGQYVYHTNLDFTQDTIYVLHLQVYPNYYVDSIIQLPVNGYVMDGYTYTQPGFYSFNYTTEYGCDSIINITLTAPPVYYVVQNGTGDGSSWADAMGDLQAAMNTAASVQGNVWVAEGTYYGDGVSENAFIIPDGIQVYGGFVGNEPVDYDLSLRDFSTHPTILDGQHVQRTVYHDWWGGDAALLDGFTIQNGHSGCCGVNVYGGGPRLQIDNCVIQNGESDGDAGGLMYATIRNSVIINNTALYTGSAFRECDAYNCIIANNYSQGIYDYTTYFSNLTNCILWGNTGYPDTDWSSITYSAIAGQEIDGEGNIILANENNGTSLDSLYVRFVDPENGDYRLACGSACINMGTPDISELGLPQVDLQGNPRVMEGRIDMGAYEFDPSWYNVEYVITASANDDEGGVVAGGGVYTCGQTCTLTAIANEGYAFLYWMQDETIVSTESTYGFTVMSDRTLTAIFVEEGSVCNIIFDLNDSCGDGWNGNYLVVTDENGISQQFTIEDGFTATYTLLHAVTGTHYILSWIEGGWMDECSFTVSYDNGTVIYESYALSEDFSYEFDVNCSGIITQVSNLAQGWNWWSTYIEQDGIDGLTMLEESLGAYGYQIKSQTDFVTNYGTMWMGLLTSINNEETYMLGNNADCQIEMTGTQVSPSDHPITISNGWNWIGYPCTNTMSVTDAFSGYTPSDGDQVKSQSDYAMYYGGMWIGQLQNIVPGTGLMYNSNNGETTTLVYPYGGRNIEVTDTPRASHWTNNVHDYPSNMTVMAVVELNDEELKSDNYELAVFDANGECRGSVRLMYVEPINRHVAFLTVSGKDAAELSFRLYDIETGMEYYDAEENLNFSINATVGDPMNLYVIHFRGTADVDELTTKVQAYPNPVNRGELFSIGMANNETKPVCVEIVNALGVETLRATSVQMPTTLTAPATAGVYTLRITVEGKGTIIHKLVVK